MIVRQARPDDALGMCAVINPLIEAGGTTAHRTPFDEQRMRTHYIGQDTRVSCAIAEGDGLLLGFQSLAWAHPTYEDLPDGWAIIATFARIDGNRKGVGRALFQETLKKARAAGVVTIDATIRKENTGGLIFYSKIGFTDWAESHETISKRFDVAT